MKLPLGPLFLEVPFGEDEEHFHCMGPLYQHRKCLRLEVASHPKSDIARGPIYRVYGLIFRLSNRTRTGTAKLTLTMDFCKAYRSEVDEHRFNEAYRREAQPHLEAGYTPQQVGGALMMRDLFARNDLALSFFARESKIVLLSDLEEDLSGTKKPRGKAFRDLASIPCVTLEPHQSDWLKAQRPPVSARAYVKRHWL